MCETVSSFILVNAASSLLAALFAFFYVLASTKSESSFWVTPRPKTLLTFARHDISPGSALGHADTLQVWHWLVDQVNRPLGQIRNHYCPPGETKDPIL